MSKVFLHPATEAQLLALRQRSPQALILHGPKGVGLRTVAHDYAKDLGELIVIQPEKDGAPDEEKGSISVERVRHLYEDTRAKGVSRTYIIDCAERMAPAAQNAFLKLLEEPGEGIRFILLTHHLDLILPTILSRTQRVDVRPLPDELTQEFLDSLSLTDATRRNQLLFIASGLPAELTRLTDEAYFTKRSTIVKDARSYITGTAYQRLQLAQRYKDSRHDALELIDSMLSQLRRSIEQKHDARTLRAIDSLMDGYERIKAQGNIRLHLATML